MSFPRPKLARTSSGVDVAMLTRNSRKLRLGFESIVSRLFIITFLEVKI